MNTKIIGILVILLVLVFGVIAFGPHTRLDRSPAVCIYFYGPGSSCEVPLYHCNADGTNNYIILNEDSCLINQASAPAQAQPSQTAACPSCPACEACPQQAAPAATSVIYNSYLWLLIPLLFLFAVLVILLLLYLETRANYYMERERLSSCVHGKKVCGVALYKEQHKKIRTLCPRDGAPMERTGQLRQGPKGGLRQTYVCPKCSHRTMRTIVKKKK